MDWDFLSKLKLSFTLLLNLIMKAKFIQNNPSEASHFHNVSLVNIQIKKFAKGIFFFLPLM